MKSIVVLASDKLKNKHLLLLLILILSGVFRFLQLGQNPLGFFCDEAAIGVNAYSILATGKDEYGKVMPVFFKSFGEFKNPISIYSSVLPIFLFGSSEFAVRFSSAFYGTLTVIVIYLLGQVLFNHQVGFWSSLFLAVSPWHVHLSRVNLEGLTAFVFFTCLGLYLWFLFWQKQGKKILFFSLLCFALALYSYFVARIFIPLLALSLVFLRRKYFLKNPGLFFQTFLLSVIFVLPLAVHLFFGSGMSRWRQVNNGLTLSKFIKSYWLHFSYDYLFAKGDAGMIGQSVTRHSVIGLGQLYLFQLPLLIFGLFFIFRKVNFEKRSILLFWFLFYPIASSLTENVSPQATRSIIGVIPFQVLSAYGLVCFINFLSQKSALLLCLPFIDLVGFSVVDFIVLYKDYPTHSSDYWGWQWGMRPIVEYFSNHQSQYDQLLVTHRINRGETVLAFYQLSITCPKCKVAPNPIVPDETKKQLFAVREEGLVELIEFNPDLIAKEFLYYPDGQVAFWLVDF